MNNNHYVMLHLSLAAGVGALTIDRVRHRKPHTIPWTDLYRCSVSDFISWGIESGMAQRMVVGLADRKLLEDELRLIEKNNIAWMSCLDEQFPSLLCEINGVPPIIYWMGEMPRFEKKSLAIVGSRTANDYARNVVEKIVPPLVTNGWTIVSGGALGVDGMAHASTLQARGMTMVVLGSGLLHWYPSEHNALFDAVIGAGGALLSIFPLSSPPVAGNFPARNRVISGLTRGTVVVQAAYKSGASITARYALDQGRELFAVPGDVFDTLSAGPHYWLQQGATLVTSAADILTSFGEHVVVDNTVPTDPVQTMFSFEVSQKKSSEKKNAKKQDSEADALDHVADPNARLVLQCCMSEGKTFEALAAATGLPEGQLQALLFDLQCEGKITHHYTGQWIKG